VVIHHLYHQLLQRLEALPPSVPASAVGSDHVLIHGKGAGAIFSSAASSKHQYICNYIPSSTGADFLCGVL
jgi:hypothetical protein